MGAQALVWLVRNMDMDAAINESMLLDRCRLEQRNHIYCAADGRRVYFFAGLIGPGCLVEDIAGFSLIRSRHHQMRERVMRCFVLFYLVPPLLRLAFPQFDDLWIAKALRINLAVVALALLTSGMLTWLQIRSLYRRFGAPENSPSRRERREQRREVVAGKLPTPLRSAQTLPT